LSYSKIKISKWNNLTRDDISSNYLLCLFSFLLWAYWKKNVFMCASFGVLNFSFFFFLMERKYKAAWNRICHGCCFTVELMTLISHRVVFTNAISNRGLNNAMVQIHHHSLLGCGFFICNKNYQNNTIENYSGLFFNSCFTYKILYLKKYIHK